MLICNNFGGPEKVLKSADWPYNYDGAKPSFSLSFNLLLKFGFQEKLLICLVLVN